MRLTCPNCQTEYDVPEEAVAGRPRTLRCTQCGQQWRHEVAADEVAAPAAPEPATPEPLIDAPPLAAATVSREVPRRPVARPAPPKRRWLPGVVVLVVVALVVVILAAHRPVMRAWPASAGFYRALGLK